MHGRNERVLRARRQPEAGERGGISALQSGCSKCGRRGAGPARPVRRRARRPDFAEGPWPGGQAVG